MALTLASNAITFTDNTSLSSGIIGTAQLSAGAVTTDKINSGAVTFDKISQNAVTSEKINSGAVTFDKISQNSGPFNFRNKIINGNFDIWQRGTTIASNSLGNSIYSADRWIIRGSGSSGTVSRQEFSLGQTDVLGDPTYFCQIVNTSVTGASNSVVLRQRIENIRTLAGKVATLSFWAKSPNAPKKLGVLFLHEVGTGGTGDSFGDNPITFDLTTSWQKFTHTFTVPSIAGKTIGDGHHLGIDFYTDAGTNFDTYFSPSVGNQSGTFHIAQVQLEEGPVATPFEQRPIGLELSLCERYYQTLGELAFNGATLNSPNTRGTWQFRQIMRATPQIGFTIVNGSAVTAFPDSSKAAFVCTSDNNNIVQLNNLTAAAEL